MSLQLFVRYYRFFFFQAEDGIRDYKVTGVQTCALPISGRADLGTGEYLECARMHVDRSSTDKQMLEATFRSGAVATGNAASGIWTASIPRRSEERRVGKESRSKRVKKEKNKRRQT